MSGPDLLIAGDRMARAAPPCIVRHHARKSRVVCVGIAVVDTIFAVDRLPLAPGKNLARSVVQIGGIAEELEAWRVELQCHPAGGGRRLTALDRPGRCQRRASDRRAVRFAAAAAAVECTRYGWREGVPDRAAVERMMKENG